VHNLRSLIFDPTPLKTLAKKIIKKFHLGTYEQCLRIGAVDRPHYGYCVFQACQLAKRLDYKRISILEYGVAGGNGLMNLEYHSQEIEKLLGVEIEIYGFDSGKGLPKPIDYRDLPYLFRENFYEMDIQKLEGRLKRAKLILGDIKDTSMDFFERINPPPIGAVFYDFDFYSSTITALNMLDSGEKYFLPRMFCYFDDTVGSEIQLYNDYTGERLAINEFNQTHSDIKISPAYHLLAKRIIEPWYHRIWISHFFKHSDYNKFISAEDEHYFKLGSKDYSAK